MADSLLAAQCELKFGTALAIDQCLRLMAELFRLDEATAAAQQTNSSLDRCPAQLDAAQPGHSSFSSSAAPLLTVVHNPQHFHGPCTALELFCLRFLFPLLQLLSLAGNLLNLLVYRLPYFGDSSAVHFLRAKALANLLFVQSRLFESLHAWLPLDPGLEWLYWRTRPWLIALGNLNGTLATWMTLFVSVEIVLCVLWPFRLRSLCSRHCTLGCLLASLCLAAGIHSMYLLTHEVVMDPTSLVLSSSAGHKPCFRVAMSFRMRRPSAGWALLLERAYYWVQMSLTIVLPTLAMLVCSALILSRFTLKPQLGHAFSQRRKCVIRLTVATAASHLLLEGPGTLCYVLFAIRGADMLVQAGWVCALSAANNLLSGLNATIPFFLFLLCSGQFRQMTAVVLAALLFRRHRPFSPGCGGVRSTKLSTELLSQAGGGGPIRAHSPAGGSGGSHFGSSALTPPPPTIGGFSSAAAVVGVGRLLEEAEERRRLLTASSWTNGTAMDGGTSAIGGRRASAADALGDEVRL